MLSWNLDWAVLKADGSYEDVVYDLAHYNLPETEQERRARVVNAIIAVQGQ
jgi:hypothetical protein